MATVGMRSSRGKGKQSGNRGSCAGRMAQGAGMWHLPTSTQSNGRWKTGGWGWWWSSLCCHGGAEEAKQWQQPLEAQQYRSEGDGRNSGIFYLNAVKRGGGVYLSWVGEGRWGGGGGCTANSLRWRAGRALRLITVVLLRRQTLTAAVLLKCVRVLLLRELTMVYCKKSREGEGRWDQWDEEDG